MTEKLLNYFNGDELAANVWLTKYAQDGEETPDDMFRRMAKEFARVEDKYNNALTPPYWNSLSFYGRNRDKLTEESIYNLFKGFEQVIAQGSVMAGLGSGKPVSLSNCVVIPSPEDSYNSIMYADTQLTALYRRRCGVGTDISNLRPNGSLVGNTANSSTGAVSFMHRFSNTTREVAQGGGRRGALMLTMDVRHPDILEFINVKQDLTQVTGANISIKVNDEFMKAVENDEDYFLRYPVSENIDEIIGADNDYPQLFTIEYNRLYVGAIDGSYYTKVRAKEIWDAFIKATHNTAEPALLYWDRMIDYSPDGVYDEFKPTSTNPCSEIGMSNDSCRLMVVNLFSFVENPFTGYAKFDIMKFYKTNYEAQRLMDDLVDLELESIENILAKIESDPEPQHVKQPEVDTWKRLYEMGKKGRRTGLGFTALGDTLAALGLKYDSDEAIEMVEKIMQMKMKSELDCTIDLAIERGSFEGWDFMKEYEKEYEYNDDRTIDKKVYYGQNSFYKFLYRDFKPEVLRMERFGRRNISWSTVAPSGSVSLLTQTTSGIEPLFQPFYIRRKKITSVYDRVDFIDNNGDKWQEFHVLHPKFKKWCQSQIDILYNIDDENPDITVGELSKEQLDYLFEMSPWYGSTANDINWIKRVEMQSVIQKYISHSISSTINLPTNVSLEEVSNIYMESWKKGLKGITVYRDGSRSGVLVSKDAKDVNSDNGTVIKRPNPLQAKVIRFNNNYEKWIAIVGLVDGKPYELFTGLSEGIGIPLNIEYGVIQKRKIDKISHFYFKYDDKEVDISKSFNPEFWNYAKLISGVLRHRMSLNSVINLVEGLNLDGSHLNTWKAGVVRVLNKFIKDEDIDDKKCPSCGDPNGLVYENGCLKCKSCGYSKCG